MLDPGPSEEVTPHRFTREEFRRVVESGALDDTRVELLRGAIVEMTPPSPLHDDLVVRLNKLLVRVVGDQAEVRPQCAFAATDDSVPLPDLAIVPPAPRLGARWPRRAWLVIEVAVSSRTRDLKTKAAIYAEAGVEEYWVVDAKTKSIIVMTQPSGSAYATRTDHGRGSVARLARMPDVAIDVDALFA